MSAANIYLLNEYSDYIDISAVDEPTITRLVAESYRQILVTERIRRQRSELPIWQPRFRQ